MRMIITLAVALMAASHSLPAGAGEKSGTAARVYDLIMEKVTSYGSLNEPKVMAICVDWDRPTEPGFYIHNVFVTYTGITSDRPIFAGVLARDAKYRCKQWAKSENIDCTCQMLDSNGKNVLKVPPRK